MDELTAKVTEIEQRCKSNTHRLDKVEKRQEELSELVSAVSAMANEQEHIKADVTEIKKDVKQLAEKPGKRWEALADKLLWAVMAALLGFLLSRLGLG